MLLSPPRGKGTSLRSARGVQEGLSSARTRPKTGKWKPTGKKPVSGKTVQKRLEAERARGGAQKGKSQRQEPKKGKDKRQGSRAQNRRPGLGPEAEFWDSGPWARVTQPEKRG